MLRKKLASLTNAWWCGSGSVERQAVAGNGSFRRNVRGCLKSSRCRITRSWVGEIHQRILVSSKLPESLPGPATTSKDRTRDQSASITPKQAQMYTYGERQPTSSLPTRTVAVRRYIFAYQCTRPDTIHRPPPCGARWHSAACRERQSLRAPP